MTGSGRLAGVLYLLLVLLQPTWHALLPAPHGAGSIYLAAAATLPLLFPLKGVMTGSLRSMTWAGYLVLLYLAIGIMEAWSNPPQRLPALLQTALSGLFVVAVLVFSRRPR